MISGIEALFTKARQSLAAAHVLIEDGYTKRRSGPKRTHSPFDFVSDTAGAKNLLRMDGLFRRDIRLSLF